MNELNQKVEQVINELVVGYEYIELERLLPHEEILEDRLKGLLTYIESLKPYIIVPSILVCADTNIIIDGHHRYYALKHLGKHLAPVVRVNYDSDKIITGLDPQKRLTKKEIIATAESKIPFKPKSTQHHFVVGDLNMPLILLSKLMLVDI